jgi:hypothetical protein
MSNSRPTPPNVTKYLRDEVGFGCPVPGCGNPYLIMHHFNPPWRDEHHFRPEGMIALCHEHAAKADIGTFTKKQLRDFKIHGKENNKQVIGRFDWMRNKFLSILGGGLYYEIPCLLRIDGHPIIGFHRNAEGYLLLNVVPVIMDPKDERFQLKDNNWILSGQPSVFECPQDGRLIHVVYPNGDMVHVEFSKIEIVKSEDLLLIFPYLRGDFMKRIEFSITTITINYVVAGLGLSIGPEGVISHNGPSVFNQVSYCQPMGLDIDLDESGNLKGIGI